MTMTAMDLNGRLTLLLNLLKMLAWELMFALSRE